MIDWLRVAPVRCRIAASLERFQDVTLRSMTDQQSFDRLEATPLTDLSGEAWDAYYTAMVPWLANDDADIRKRAIDRLFTAVLWAEPHTTRKAHGLRKPPEREQQARLN